MQSNRATLTAREAVVATALLVAASLLVYGGAWVASHGWSSPLTVLTQSGAAEGLWGLGDAALAILGVALTVVAIVVELASSRYTPRITELFVRDPINATTLLYFVVSAVVSLWIAVSLGDAAPPLPMVIVAIVLPSASLFLLIPYFGYVFDFLTPTRVVVRIGDRALRALRRAARLGDKGVPAARAEVVTAIEQLGDIALHSVENRDKGIALAAIAALAGFTEQSLTAKPTLPATWFATDALVATVDQDFASMHPDVMKALEIKRTWLEMKVLRQLQAVFEEGLEKMRDMCHLVAIRTRLIAVHAAEIGDDRAIGQALMFLNTFMRAALNHQDQRTAYNLLSEYRLLAEDLLRLDRQAIVVELALRCKYYGQLAFRLKLPFVLETVAFDLTAVLDRANVLGSPCQDQLLDILLEIDRAPESDTAQDAGLRGVRKAQAKLAATYLSRGDEARARRIYEDMRSEPPARLRVIEKELDAVAESEFWEVSDRGTNFEWLPNERRAHLRTFFSWFRINDS